MSFLTIIHDIPTSMGNFISKISVNLDRWYSRFVTITHTEATITIDQTESKTIEIESVHVETYEDAVEDMVSLNAKEITITNSSALTAVDTTESKTPALGREAGLQMWVKGCITATHNS